MARSLAAQRAAARRSLPYERSVLSNGLRVVSQEMPAARSLSAALFVGVGSRHEDDAHAGLSHLLEHLVFKGTQGYPDPRLAERRDRGLRRERQRQHGPRADRLQREGAGRARANRPGDGR